MKELRRAKFVCCLILCVSLFMTVCSKDSTSDNDAIFDSETMPSEGPVSHNTQERR